MLLKIYARQSDIIGSAIHIIEDVKDVIVYEGTFILPDQNQAPALPLGPSFDEPTHQKVYAISGNEVRIIDYTKDNTRLRAVVPFAYVCNENGKTIERVETNSGVL